MQLASCSKDIEGDVPGVLYEFTPEQVKALEETRRKLNFTPEEVEERLRRTQADLEWIVTGDTPQEQQRRADRVWAERVERPRAVRRIQSTPARRPRLIAMVVPRPRAREHRPVATRRTSSSSRTASQDPGDSDPDPPGFELALVDEQPAAQPAQRFCRCDRDRPYTAPDWDIGPDEGKCRSCTRPLRDSDVRRWHFIARAERERLDGKGWYL